MSSRESKLATIERGLNPGKHFDILWEQLEPSIREIAGYGVITTKPDILDKLLTLIKEDGLSSHSLNELAEKTRRWNNSGPFTDIWLLEDLHGKDERYGGEYWTARMVKSEIVRLHNYPEATMLGYDTLRNAIQYFRERGQIPDFLYKIAAARIPGGLKDA
ncbi:MAG: hypothetical protein ACREAY_01045 [Nitrososphaera sp.]|uniref:hypothetical protein n=1 Tax=Nitrososphaera sp. TaxID=1971748 RepID=UPI003D6F0E92